LDCLRKVKGVETEVTDRFSGGVVGGGVGWCGRWVWKGKDLKKIWLYARNDRSGAFIFTNGGGEELSRGSRKDEGREGGVAKP